jgi:hypothetical protein
MKEISAHKAGLAVGLVIAGWHLLWSALVFTGVAQSVLNFVFWIHFISPAYTVEAFDSVRALLLVAVTLVLGYAVGSVCAALWNRLHR